MDTLFTPEEKLAIKMAIKSTELFTSCEIRVHIEKKCKENIGQHVAMLFEQLGMYKTHKRNGVLFYVSWDDKKTYIHSDIGINQKVDSNFWEDTLNTMHSYLQKNDLTTALVWGIENAGHKLKELFPYEENTDTNELSDELSFG